MKQANFNFTISGFIIALLLVTLAATTIGTFISGLQDEYGVPGNSSIGAYNITSDIVSKTYEIKNATDIKQESGWLDVIGGYFSAGYQALKISISSFDLFDTMMNQAASDTKLHFFGYFKTVLVAIVIIAIFLGVVISALLKMRI